MSASLARRIAKLEPRIVPQRVPHVVIVPTGGTSIEAIAAFKRQHARKLKPYHTVLVLPARIEGAEAEADFKDRFFAHQTRLVADAKSSTKDMSNG